MEVEACNAARPVGPLDAEKRERKLQYLENKEFAKKERIAAKSKRRVPPYSAERVSLRSTRTIIISNYNFLFIISAIVLVN